MDIPPGARERSDWVAVAGEEHARVDAVLRWLLDPQHPVHGFVRTLHRVDERLEKRAIFSILLRDRIYSALLQGESDEALLSMHRAEHGIAE